MNKLSLEALSKLKPSKQKEKEAKRFRCGAGALHVNMLFLEALSKPKPSKQKEKEALG
jgi:hypothetical protein